MNIVYFVVVVLGIIIVFAGVVIAMLSMYHKERLELAKIAKQKDVAYAKLLRITDPTIIPFVEPIQEEVKEEEKSDLVDIEDMPRLTIDEGN